MNFGNIQDGYPGLAKLIGPNIDQGLGIFKQFAELNARNLLYMQSELLCLQKELELLTYIDENGPDPKSSTFSRIVWNIRESPTSAQWAKVIEIREKLNAHNACLPQQVQITTLDCVNSHDLTWLTGSIHHKEGGNGFLSGLEFKAYDTRELSYLFSISSRASNDWFSRWLEVWIVPRLPEWILRVWREPIRGSEKVIGLSRCNLKLLARVLAATILSIAVLALYFISSQERKLAAVAVFSCLFSLVLAVCTTSRPVEIFTATAAFASVQVVFVGTSGASEGAQLRSVPGNFSINSV